MSELVIFAKNLVKISETKSKLVIFADNKSKLVIFAKN